MTQDAGRSVPRAARLSHRGIRGGIKRFPSRVVRESLSQDARDLFHAESKGNPERGIRTSFAEFTLPLEKGKRKPRVQTKDYRDDRPVVFQFWDDVRPNLKDSECARLVLWELRAFRFLDLSPTQMRIPSQPGQTILGDRGENLSSVLAAICQDLAQKEVLLAWVRKLTPMDVDDLRFDQDAAGRILLRLVEKDGRSVSALSASDGTLRFLAILAAIFGPEPASFYFIEELENGIHPTRLGLLIDLIEHQAKRRGIQIVATSHSPQLLQFLSEESLEHASLVYRLPDHPDGRIKRIVDIPEARRVIKEQPVWMLLASSWFEDVLDLTEDTDAEPVPGNGPARKPNRKRGIAP